MKRNPILYLLLAILIAQPLLLVGFGPSPTATVLQPDDGSVLSQGTRLDPGDHTDHVPIFINGTGDFVAQSWPGAGTSGDPYVIAGLNITYDLSLVGIWIINTDAYFVIRDCYVNQLSSEYALHLENVSHATIEYTTVVSSDTAIYVMNSNDTSFQDLDVFTDVASSYALELLDSDDCSLQFSLLNSTAHSCIYANNSHSFELQDNVIESHESWRGVDIQYCLYFSSTRDRSVNSNYGFYLVRSNSTQIRNAEVFQPADGIRIENSQNVNITEAKIWELTGEGIRATNTPQVRVVDSEITDGDDDGIYLNFCNNSFISGNTITDVVFDGIDLNYCYDSTIIGNTVANSDDHGIELSNSDDTLISSNTVYNTVDRGISVSSSHRVDVDLNVVYEVGTNGIYVTSSDNGTISNNEVFDVSNDGISLDTCTRWYIHENEISDCGNVGVHITGGAFTDVWLNDISDTDDIGLYVLGHGMFEAWENTMTETEGGIYVSGSDETYIRDNEVYSSTAYGMYIGNSENHTIDDNSFYDCVDYGIELSDCDTSSFSGNQIFTGPTFGFYLSHSEYNTFSGNLLTDCGFYFEEDGGIPTYNHTFTGNEVNSLPALYSIDAASGSYSGGSYGQMILVLCNDTTITGGTFDRASAPILLYHSLRTTIDGVTLLNNFFGILNEVSDNTTIVDSVLDHCDYGAFVRDSPFVSILDTDFSNGENAIDTYDVSFMTISGCTFTNMADRGFHTQTYALNCSILDSHFYNITSYGVYIDGNSDYWNITGNLFEHCDFAIYFTDTSTDYGWIIGNEIYNSITTGIYFLNADYYDIQNNTILWSGNYGLNIGGSALISAGWQICYNTIGLSGTDNAYDNQAGNIWDDEVDTGNWWDDYSGTGTYAVPGAGAVDNYPMQFLPTEPILNELMDVFYAEGSTGNEISWMPYDNYLKDYTVTIGGVLWEQDAVPGIVQPTITVNIDGLSYGTHTLVITVYDIDLNSVSDTVMIHVFDDTAPTINNPANFEIFLGVTGNEIVWEADDLNPGSYVAMMDGSQFATDSWTSGSVILDIDGLSAGAHHFTMTVYDLDGNSVYDSVSILVINDATGPVVDSPDDIVFVVESTGNRIIWTPTDDYPDSFDIEFNGTTMLSGDWSGGRIIFELDNLEVGDYNFTLTVWDGGQQSVSDMVAVQVIPYEGWTPVPPAYDFTLIIIAAVGVTAVVVVIGVVYFLKFKKPSSGGA